MTQFAADTLGSTYQRDEADDADVKADVLECSCQRVGVHGWDGQQPCRHVHDGGRHKRAYHHA